MIGWEALHPSKRCVHVGASDFANDSFADQNSDVISTPALHLRTPSLNYFTLQDTRMPSEGAYQLIGSIVFDEVTRTLNGDCSSMYLAEENNEALEYSLLNVAELQRLRMRDIREKKQQRIDQQQASTLRHREEAAAMQELIEVEHCKRCQRCRIGVGSSLTVTHRGLQDEILCGASNLVPFATLPEIDRCSSDNSKFCAEDETLNDQTDSKGICKRLRRFTSTGASGAATSIHGLSNGDEVSQCGAASQRFLLNATSHAVSRYPLESRCYVERVIFTQRSQQIFALWALLCESYRHANTLHKALLYWYDTHIMSILANEKDAEARLLLEDHLQHYGSGSLARFHGHYTNTHHNELTRQLKLSWGRLFSSVKSFLGLHRQMSPLCVPLASFESATETCTAGSVCDAAAILHSMDLFERQRYLQMSIHDAEGWVRWYYAVQREDGEAAHHCRLSLARKVGMSGGGGGRDACHGSGRGLPPNANELAAGTGRSHTRCTLRHSAKDQSAGDGHCCGETGAAAP